MPEFPHPTPVSVTVTVPAGLLEIVAEERASARVDVQPYDERRESRELAEHTRIDMNGDNLIVAAPDNSWRLLRRSGAVRISIQVPLDSSGRIKTASADVSCSGRYALLAVDTASGAVRAEQVTGDATFKTMSGDLRVARVDGRLSVKTASANVTAGRVGGAVTASLASGAIDVAEADADVNAKTASGDIRIGAARYGTIRLGTASGDVEVGVRAGTGVWLDLTTVSGGTHNGLTMGGAGEDGGNGHQLTLAVRTVSGDIDVHRVG